MRLCNYCDEKHYAKGLCRSMYMKERRGTLGMATPVCMYCGKKNHAKRMCINCYRRHRYNKLRQK
jgi:hypothetical protein